MYDTYLQHLLCEGNIDEAFVGLNQFETPVPSEDPEEPPTFTTVNILILQTSDGIRYSITREQLDTEKDLCLELYPDKEDSIVANYTTLRDLMEVEQ